ncbi:rCG53388 [Rattus norvegicus]|uniref:RCG53388 n=1 Tax=Rattus norvegicus TaxID=10116 RepID=A6JRH9_RAT|nr:rCG53388 [Rattus norvegicus]
MINHKTGEDTLESSVTPAKRSKESRVLPFSVCWTIETVHPRTRLCLGISCCEGKD